MRDPVATFANIRKAMKPDGRLALAVFRTLQETIVGDSNRRSGPPPVAAYHAAGSGGAGPVLVGDAARVRRILEPAGFQERFLGATRPGYATVAATSRSGEAASFMSAHRPGGEKP